MDTNLTASGDAVFASLSQYALLYVTGDDARAFLHAQLSNDVEHQPADTARRAGYCSPKGRLLANFLVVPHEGGFLLQVSRDIAAPIAKRLVMYVMRSKVKVADTGEALLAFGAWGRGASAQLRAAGFAVPESAMQVAHNPQGSVVCVGDARYLVVGPEAVAPALAAQFSKVAPEWWTLAEVRAGLPTVSQQTQDEFVPQMANFELVGGVDFKKGCYPGQEIVARTQYLGKLKRRMYRLQTDEGVPVAGLDIFAGEPQAIGKVVNAAPRPEGGYEFLAVVQSSSVEDGSVLRLAKPDGATARVVPLPYSA